MRTLKTPVNVNYIDYFKFKIWGFILIFCVFAIYKVEAQINLAPSSIYDSRPVLTNGEYLATDYNTVSRPLVLEAFATNAKIGVTSGSIYAPAAGRDSVFFGGDEPSDGFGAGAWPIYTKRVFKKSDFPIQMSCSFFSREDVPLYNESYLVLVPANYKYFATSTYYVDGQYTQREGLLFGGFPFRSQIFDNKGNSQSLVIRRDVTHNYALNGKWFTMEVYLYLSGNDLIIKYLKVDGSSVFPDDFNLGEFSYLDDFRLGIAADDMAHGFRIVHKNSKVEARFDSLASICEEECVAFENKSELREDGAETFTWVFPGGTPSTSSDKNPINICYFTEGTYSVTLIASDGVTKDTVVNNIVVTPDPKIDLGNDTLVCESSILLDASYPLASYVWSDGSNDPILEFNEAGEYWVHLTLGNCEFRDTIVLDFKEEKKISLGLDTLICLGEELTLGLNFPPSWQYIWNSGSESNTLQVNQSGSFSVIAFDDCRYYKDTVNLRFEECANFKMFVPNAFTPNADENNPVFRPFVVEGSCCTVRDYEMKIYSRWGELLFDSYDVAQGWDGTYLGVFVQQGVYLCILKYKNGIDENYEKHVVNLLK
jgi:gliding motility-associated-like protein